MDLIYIILISVAVVSFIVGFIIDNVQKGKIIIKIMNQLVLKSLILIILIKYLIQQ